MSAGSSWQTVATMRTDGAGAYRFEGNPLVDGNGNAYEYRVVTDRPAEAEFVPSHAGASDNFDSDIDPLEGDDGIGATDALTVGQLLGYGESIHGKVVKVSGTVGAGTLGPAGQDVRFRLTDDEALSVTLPVAYDGALSDEVTDGSAVVLTGSLGKDGAFIATDVALEA